MINAAQLSLLTKNQKFIKPKKTVRLGTLFSGIGAVEQAFKLLKIPHEIIYASDNDKFAKESYLSNYSIIEKEWYDDVKDINGLKYKYKTDVIVGGAPCQPFSMVGKRRGLDDARGTLFYDFARIVNESKPKMFIYENVKGILSMQNGDTYKTIKKTFNEAGYTNLHDAVLNAKDYGIPQNRQRLFLIGFRKKKFDFYFPEKQSLKLAMQDLLENITFDSKYTLPPKGVKFVTNSKNLNKRYTQINGNIALCQKANQQFNWHGDFVHEEKKVGSQYYLSEKVQKYVMSSGTKNFYSKAKIDLEIARPLISTMHKMHRAGVDNYISEGEKIRRLTPRECLRLMGFPDSFKQVVSNTQMYRQAGNSIVVNVLMAILKQIDFDNL
jgi:DNA (cytosine-5)-methyltransferase 1